MLKNRFLATSLVLSIKKQKIKIV